MIWLTSDPDSLGYLPTFLSELDERPAREQLHQNYGAGGGWRPFSGFHFDLESETLSFPGDPPMKPIGATLLRDEHIYLFPYSWVLVLQADGSYEVARMD